MEVQNSAAESQSSDRSQPIQERDGDGGSVMAGGPADVLVGAAVDGGEVEMELGNGGGGAEMVKKKRGRPPRVQAKSPPAKIHKEEDEDVCFICFDGGSLVLCDRRGCPKAYHPACVKRDEAFFQAKAKWNCGWHICSICQKAAQHMCYTCTYSLCKGCIKKSDYVCVRGDKGFCTVCMKTIMLIENKGQGKDETAQVDFDDKSSWEYLFKVYWVYLKGKLSLTLDELTQAKNPWKGANITASVSPSTCVNDGDNDLKSIPSDTSIPNLESSESKRRKTDEQIIIIPSTTEKMGTDEKTSGVACKDWATKELLDFVAHMKNGDKSMLSQYDVQELMLEYIKRNNLRDPRKKSQIICDSRLKNLFGKPRVGHFEMLKLLEFHFFIKEDLPKNTINNIARHVDPDWNGDNNNLPVVGKEKRRRNHRKGEERAPPNKLDEYAAIDVHNITLVYLRRKLMENLIVDKEEFHGKVVGSIVRIRISGSDQKHDMYRLVQVVGTSKADVPYKIGDKSADVVLEVLNLDKKETVSIDTISNQDLSEDECRRLRQSIKCGLVKRFTVGEIEEKAVALQSVRLNDWMEGEILRLNNLRDRASEKGHKKGLREYVEKLQLLKTPEERERRLREIPEVHSDPKMNPDYETDDTEEYFNKEHGEHTKPKPSVGKNTISPKKRLDFSNDVSSRSRKNEHPRHLNVVTSKERSTKSTGKINTVKEAYGPSTLGRGHNNNNNQTTGINTTISNDGEIEKIWHYRDPSGKIQGPFCMVQLQKWSTTGYFPDNMRIWTNQEDESLLLNDVLKAQLENVRLTEGLTATGKVGIRKIEGLIVCTASPSSTVHPSSEKSNELTGRFYTTDLASPTPDENNGEIKHVSSVFDTVDLPSPTPKETSICEDEKVQEKDLKLLVQTQIPKMGHEWGGYSPTQVKREEWRDPASNIGQIIHSSSSSACDYSTPWNGVRETIEFSTLAEESVSDLLAEVEAKESQNGLPSPTSRGNSLVDDLFNGSFDEFSPTSGQATRSNGFSSNGGDIQPTATTNVFDFIKLENMPFKWSEMQKQPISHDVNNSTSHVQVEEKTVQTGPDHGASDTCHDRLGGSSSGQCTESSPELVQVSQRTGQKGTTAASPPPPPSLATRRVGPEVGWDPHTNTTRSSNVGWDPHQRMHDGERHNNNNNNNNNNRNGKSWGRQSSFGSGGGGGYLRPPPPKGQRVCKFYESGRCKKGASCNYWHP